LSDTRTKAQQQRGRERAPSAFCSDTGSGSAREMTGGGAGR